jgi:hypothetical protein
LGFGGWRIVFFDEYNQRTALCRDQWRQPFPASIFAVDPVEDQVNSASVVLPCEGSLAMLAVVIFLGMFISPGKRLSLNFGRA